jgi:catechol 2,3-dioxygenase-like lactoylglutathione lyase family enzyme
MKIERLDHFVLTVKNLQTTVDFYTQVMGMKAIQFGEGRWALEFGQQKINLHELGNEFEPKAQNVREGSADLCFITETELAKAMAHVEAQGIEILEGPVKRTGAQGPILSCYLPDPDGNLIEVSNY